jgi:hypothetical protein
VHGIFDRKGTFISLGASQGTGPTDKGTEILISAARERWVVAFLPKQSLCRPDFGTSLRSVLRWVFTRRLD